MLSRVILDTNVLVSAFTSADGASRQVLRQVLSGRAVALLSVALYAEYADVLHRADVMKRCPLSSDEVDALFDAFLSGTELVNIFYNWRPNLRDESDNHVFELAVAAGDAPLLTYNVKDFAYPQLKFPALKIFTPAEWLAHQRSN